MFDDILINSFNLDVSYKKFLKNIFRNFDKLDTKLLVIFQIYLIYILKKRGFYK